MPQTSCSLHFPQPWLPLLAEEQRKGEPREAFGWDKPVRSLVQSPGGGQTIAVQPLAVFAGSSTQLWKCSNNNTILAEQVSNSTSQQVMEKEGDMFTATSVHGWKSDVSAV